MHHQYGISALVTLVIILRGKQWWYALFWILSFLDPYLHIRLQAQVVEKLDNDIQWINHYPENKAIIVLIRQIVIYPVDSVIQPLNNWVLRILNPPFIWESYCSTYQEQQGWGGDGDIFVVVVLSWKKINVYLLQADLVCVYTQNLWRNQEIGQTFSVNFGLFTPNCSLRWLEYYYTDIIHEEG